MADREIIYLHSELLDLDYALVLENGEIVKCAFNQADGLGNKLQVNYSKDELEIIKNNFGTLPVMVHHLKRVFAGTITEVKNV